MSCNKHAMHKRSIEGKEALEGRARRSNESKESETRHTSVDGWVKRKRRGWTVSYSMRMSLNVCPVHNFDSFNCSTHRHWNSKKLEAKLIFANVSLTWITDLGSRRTGGRSVHSCLFYIGFSFHSFLFSFSSTNCFSYVIAANGRCYSWRHAVVVVTLWVHVCVISKQSVSLCNWSSAGSNW